MSEESKFIEAMQKNATRKGQFYFTKKLCEKKIELAKYIFSLLPMNRQKLVAKCCLQSGFKKPIVNEVLYTMKLVEDIKEQDGVVAVAI